MHAPKASTHAVLMADIVGSARAPPLKVVQNACNKVVRRANEVDAEHIGSPLKITLGDEFQGLLTSFAHAWDTAVALRLELLVAGIPCRFVVGVATLETSLNTKEAWNMMGRGLSAARDKLNEK